MAQVALKREIEGYQDILNKYNREAQRYSSAATTHNAAVDAYNAFLKNKFARPENLFDQNARGDLVQIAGSKVTLIKAADRDKYNVLQVPGPATNKAWVIPKSKDDPIKPSEFTLKPPTEPGPNPAKDYTASQLKTLDEPSLTDIERNQPSGLISSSFKGY